VSVTPGGAGKGHGSGACASAVRSTSDGFRMGRFGTGSFKFAHRPYT
jgi:hypothetical protein